MIWPPDYTAEFNRRLSNRNNLLGEEKRQAHINAFYATHPHEWINDWAVTFDPRAAKPKPRTLPFVLFDRQRDFIDFILGCYNDKESGLVEKSRDMGATWLCCAISVWLWLYHPGTVVGWGSLKAEQVDKFGDMKAIFPKMRMIIQFLPPWMLPEGFRMSVHATYNKILNPINGSTIIGECGDNMGRGGRTSIYFKDESAHYERPESIEAALGDNTDVQIDMSSVNGTANVFYRRRMAGEIWHRDNEPTEGKTRIFIFDWKDNPLKDEKWYLRRKHKAEAEGLSHIFAQEVDRDYAGSQERVIIPAEWVRAAVDAHIKLKIPKGGLRVAGQDVADGGGDKNALIGREGIVCMLAEQWGGKADEAAEIAIPMCVEHGMQELYYDSPGVGVGFKTQINNMKKDPSFPKRMRIFPWNPGAPPLDPDDHIIPNDRESPLNKDHYHNLKAQAWFRVRSRFYKTYRAVNFGDKYNHDELVSIDSTLKNREQLMMELSQAVRKDNGDRKTVVDKQPKGSLSPNLADGFVQCYNPCRELTIFDVLE